MPSSPLSSPQKLAAQYGDSGRYFRGSFRDDGLEAILDARRRNDLSGNITHANYRPRTQERYLLIKDHFASFLGGDILDVGSRDKTIQELLGPGCQLIDKNNPNLPPFDWEKEHLPYADGRFDAVVCLDVLEHINRLHEAFDDLLRVSKKYVIISLPNCWRKTFKHMLKGEGARASYGLPPEPPMDRHRWFFNPQDVDDFLAYRRLCPPYRFRIAARVYHVPLTTTLHRIVYPIVMHLLPRRYTKNLLVNTAFYVLEKV